MRRWAVGLGMGLWTVAAQAAVTTETLQSVTVTTASLMQTAIAQDNRNTVHLAFYDPAAQAIKYAKLINGTTTWALSTVAGSATTGPQVALALEGTTPHVVYYDTTSGSEGVKHARLGSGGSWSISTVESFVGTNTYVALALGTDNLPRVAYYNSASSATSFGLYDGSAWNTYTVLTTTFAGPVDLALTSSDEVRLAFVAGSTVTQTRQLCSAVSNVSSFTVTTLFDVGVETAPVGGVSLAVDGSDRSHIAVYDGAQDGLGYVRLSSTGGFETSVLVDTASGAGFSNEILTTAADVPTIVYATEGVGLRQASLGTSWALSTMVSSTDVFTGLSAALNPFGHVLAGVFQGGANALQLVTDAPRNLSLSGAVTDFSATALTGASLSLSGMIATTAVPLTSTGGFTVPYLWEGNYTLVPALSGYAFQPSGRSYSPLTANQTTQNFEGGLNGFSVAGNVFNPLNSEQAQITYSVLPGPVSVRLFTLQGRPVIKLVDETKSTAVTETVFWNGRTEDGDVVASGVYLVLFESGVSKDTKKIVVVK